ncbi:MAG: hypothetical protein AAGE43_10210 [Pseudomonadota bacterium]
MNSLISEVSHKISDGVLIVRMHGRVSLNLLRNYVTEHVSEFAAHDRLIYDLRDWDVSALTTESLMNADNVFTEVHALRKQGRAALIIQQHMEELGRIFVAVYESKEVPVDIGLFSTDAEADQWVRST